jgi:hypothetical protein
VTRTIGFLALVVGLVAVVVAGSGSLDFGLVLGVVAILVGLIGVFRSYEGQTARFLGFAGVVLGGIALAVALAGG